MIFDYYSPQLSCGKVMFLHLSVILSKGGVCLSACWNRHPLGRNPLGQTPPWTDTPTPSRRLLQRTVRILLECILVFLKFCYYHFCSLHHGKVSVGWLVGAYRNHYIPLKCFKNHNLCRCLIYLCQKHVIVNVGVTKSNYFDQKILCNVGLMS